MPRKVDPAQIKVGKGLAPEGTVEDTSFRYPERDVDPLRVHIHDPSRAHMASAIGIVDAGDCYVSDEVEGALQEICSGAGAGRLNGLISGGTFNELSNVANGSGSVATTTLTLETTTEIMVGPGVFNASALVASLSGLAAGSYYVYFDTNSSSPSFRTLVVSAAVPQVETATGIEHVLLAKFSYDAGGNVTAWQDGRFFVRNLDRKVQYSSRQGENVDAWSEGCFATLQAFFLWMAEYGEGSGTPSEEEKGTVIIRGEHQFPSTLTIPTNHLQFVGDGNAILSTPVAGFTGTRLLDISGRTNITFRNLTFVARTAGLTAIFSSGQALSDIRVEDCTFSNASTQWDRGVDLGNTAATGENVYIKDSTFYIPTNAGGGTTHLGVNLYGIKHARVTGCRFIANGLQDTAGISIGETNHKSVDVVVSDCYFSGMALGMKVEFADHVKLVDNTIEGTTKGIISTRGTSAPNNNTASTDYLISGNSIELATTGFVGISLREVTAATIESNHLACTGSGPFGAVSDLAVGIEFTSVAGAGGLNGVPSDLRITGNNIVGFYDTTSNPTPQGFPILVTGEGGAGTNNPVKNVVIADNTINEGGIQIADAVEHFAITNNVLDGLVPGTPTVLSVRGISLTTAGATTPPQNGVISGNIIRRYKDGIILAGSAADTIKSVDIDQNHISEITSSYDGSATDTFTGFGTKGIGLLSCADCSITRNTIFGTGVSRNNAGTKLVFPNNIQCLPIYVRDCAEGIRTEGNTILDSTSQGTGKVFGIVYVIGAGVTAPFTSSKHLVSDNEIEMVDPDNDSFAGIYFNIGDSSGINIFSDVAVRNNSVKAAGATTQAPSHGLLFQSQRISDGQIKGGTYEGITVAENSVAGFRRAGIAFDNDASAAGVQAQPCVFRNIDILRNHLQSTIPVTGQDQGGVVLKVAAQAAGNSILNAVSIIQNKILMPSAPDGGGHFGINLVSNRTGSTALFRGLTINENRIPTVNGGVGINVDRLGLHGADNRQDFQISRNRVGVGQRATAGGSPLQPSNALNVNLGDSDLAGFRVDDNTFYTTLRSIFIQNTTPTPATVATLQDVSVCRNMLNRGSGIVTTVECMNLQFVNLNLFDVTVNDNEVFAVGSTTTTHAIQIRNTNATVGAGAAVTVDRLKMCGNQMAGSGELKLLFDGITATNLSINDNTLTNGSVVTTAVSINTIFNYDTARSQGSVLNLAIKNNMIRGGKIGIGATFDDLQHGGVKITGNQIRNLVGAAITVGGSGFDSTGIHFQITGTLDLVASNQISIEDNSISGEDDGVAIRYEQESTNVRARGLSICRNKVIGDFDRTTGSKVFGAIDLDFSPTATSIIEGVQVDGNEIAPRGTTLASYAKNGITLTGPTSLLNHTIENISVSHNAVGVRAPDSSTPTTGIEIEFLCVESTPYYVRNLVVDGNILVLGDKDGVPGSGTTGIGLNLTCQIENLSVQKNSLMGQWGESNNARVSAWGIRLYHQFTDTQSIANTTSGVFLVGTTTGASAANADLGWETASNTFTPVLAVCWRNVNVSGNTVLFHATRPLATLLTDQGQAALTLAHVRSTGLAAQPVDIKKVVVPLWGFTSTGNTLTAVKRGGNNTAAVYRGVFFETANSVAKWPLSGGGGGGTEWLQFGWSVVGNSSTAFSSQNTAGSTYYGVDVKVVGSGLVISSAVVMGNIASDSSNTTGWDALGGTGDNINLSSRTLIP